MRNDLNTRTNKFKKLLRSNNFLNLLWFVRSQIAAITNLINISTQKKLKFKSLKTSTTNKQRKPMSESSIGTCNLPKQSNQSPITQHQTPITVLKHGSHRQTTDCQSW